MITAKDILKENFWNGKFIEINHGEDLDIEDCMNEYLQKSLEELYLECEHGDEEHRKWLKDKFDDFLKRKQL